MANNISMPDVGYPINSYSDLQNAIMLWADRDDEEFIRQIPNFIDFAQKDIYRKLRIQPIQKEAYLPISGGIADLPMDYLQMTYCYFAENGVTMRVTSPEEFSNNQAKWDGMTKPPAYAQTETIFAQFGTRLFFYPQIEADVPDQDGDYTGPIPENAVVIGYYSDPQRMSKGTDDPYLLEIAPDAFLYKSLAHAAFFVQDMQAYSTFNGKGESIIANIQSQQDEMEYSGSPLVITNNNPSYGYTASVYRFI